MKSYAAKTAARLLVSVVMALGLATTSASAQECLERTGQATGASKEAAMRLAYEGMLTSIDTRLAGAWRSAGQRVGDAPGYSVRKLTSQCSAGGSGQICRMAATLCRN